MKSKDYKIFTSGKPDKYLHHYLFIKGCAHHTQNTKYLQIVNGLYLYSTFEELMTTQSNLQ